MNAFSDAAHFASYNLLQGNPLLAITQSYITPYEHQRQLDALRITIKYNIKTNVMNINMKLMNYIRNNLQYKMNAHHYHNNGVN